MAMGQDDGQQPTLFLPFYAEVMGRPGLAPGVYFRCLLIGYFEGISSERGIAWRVADSLSLRRFLGLNLERTTPDHSTISRTRRRLPGRVRGRRRRRDARGSSDGAASRPPRLD